MVLRCSTYCSQDWWEWIEIFWTSTTFPFHTPHHLSLLHESTPFKLRVPRLVGTETRNLWIRSPTHYPLRYKSIGAFSTQLPFTPSLGNSPFLLFTISISTFSTNIPKNRIKYLNDLHFFLVSFLCAVVRIETNLVPEYFLYAFSFPHYLPAPPVIKSNTLCQRKFGGSTTVLMLYIFIEVMKSSKCPATETQIFCSLY